jgi:hypothetical protein
MFDIFQNPAAAIADSISVLLIVGVIVTSAQFPRRAVLGLSGIAVTLLGLLIAGYVYLAVLQPHVDSRLASILDTLRNGALNVSAALALAAWVVSLWRAAKTVQWGWFMGLLPFVLLSILWPIFFGHPELILGQAAANQLMTSSFYLDLVVLFSFLGAQLLTPLATLVYAIVTPGAESQTQARTVQSMSMQKRDGDRLDHVIP